MSASGPLVFISQPKHVVGTQEPPQWDSSFENLKHMFKLMSKKMITFYAQMFCLSGLMRTALSIFVSDKLLQHDHTILILKFELS